MIIGRIEPAGMIQMILCPIFVLMFSVPLVAATPSEDFAHLAVLIEANEAKASLEWIHGPEFVAGLAGQEQIDAIWTRTRQTMQGYLEHRHQLRFAEAKRFRFRNNEAGFNFVPVTIEGVEKLQMMGNPKGNWIPGKIVTREHFEKAIATGELVAIE